MATMGSLWDFEGLTPDAGPVNKDAGTVQATVNGSPVICKSPNGASLNGSTPASNHAPNSAESENSPEAVLSNGQIRDVFQNARGVTVRINRARWSAHRIRQVDAVGPLSDERRVFGGLERCSEGIGPRACTVDPGPWGF